MIASLLFAGCERWSGNDCCIRDIYSFQKPPLQRLLFSLLDFVQFSESERECPTMVAFLHAPLPKMYKVKLRACLILRVFSLSRRVFAQRSRAKHFIWCVENALRAFSTHQINQALAAGERLRS